MELSNHQVGDIPIPIPIPINTTPYGHIIHHDHHPHPHHHHQHQQQHPHNHIIHSSSSSPPLNSNNGPPALDHDHHDHHDHHHHNSANSFKKMMKYKECLKNHAASMGGNATDGCGEFMPSGEDGTIEALTCSACNCHRNFHRKETEGDQIQNFSPHFNRVGSRKLILGPHHHHKNNILGPPEGYPRTAILPHNHQMIMSYNMGGGGGGGGGSLASESDEQEDGNGGVVMARPHHHHQQLVKKRHRTKFSQEQKEKMMNFAEKVGWKIQKQEESVVQQLCQEIGVKRRVLKVWMHNNKHNLAKKNPLITAATAPNNAATTTSLIN
ncbi:zinc-finger homeodomain protein 3 [Mercurialis annua]|uniref:zinc-finger homeodomain protein 3 n=1 Tax=Mercurialis annua TaxID=3986 RepID=UPI0021604F69|nr:zinc-finger homeodomain protein 3 [Mercurialis annua]